MGKENIQLIWLKRDLRLHDHQPLAEAIRTGLPILTLFWMEPSLRAVPQSDVRHWRFAYQSAMDVRDRLARHGLPMWICNGEVLPSLKKLSKEYELAGLWSHQETGLKITYERDLAVKAWCVEHGIPWREFRQDGVFRGLRCRDGWQERWEKDMRSPLAQPDWANARAPKPRPRLESALAGPPLPEALRTAPDGFQPGGETAGRRYLQSFLESRAHQYSRHLSKPLASRRSCSRLSPYIAWGCLSVREVWQRSANLLRHANLGWNLENFHSRLWWRSHYIQKLESEWQIEFEPINRGMRALDRTTSGPWLDAWAAGRTGFPMADASIRCLKATGWINFRMRAMLATLASFPLWLDWQPVAHQLAQWFTDFEPGIHYGQIQMQAGLTGYHPLRIFNPIVQAEQHDPDGAFVRRWIPELAWVPAPLIYRPWTMTPLDQKYYHCELGKDYPRPWVAYDEATRQAKARYWAVRMSPAVQKRLPALWARHCLPKNIAEYRAINGIEQPS